MKKIIFLKKSEIEEVLNEHKGGNGLIHKIDVDEETGKDVLVIGKNNERDFKIVKKLPFEDTFVVLNERFDVTILSFDVYELSDLGDGFAFDIK